MEHARGSDQEEVQPATTWGMGSYALMAERLASVAARLVAELEIGPGDRVVDIACGTGSAAVAAARRGASVTGVDFEPALIALAERSARCLGLDIRWVVADAAATGLPSHEFHAVVSSFGVMYAQPHAAAAAEPARLLAPGGRLGLTAWLPDSFMPKLGAALAPFLPPPPAGDPPSAWGDADRVTALLSEHGIRVATASRDVVRVEFATVAEAVDFLIVSAGHVVAEQPRLEERGRWESLRAELERLVEAERERDGDAPVTLALDYLLVLGRKR